MNTVVDRELIDNIFSKEEDTIETQTHQFKEYHFSADDFLNKSCIWYGTSGSGKSFHIKYCLYQVRHLFPRVILFSTTNRMNKDFDGIINSALIYDELTELRFIELMKTQIEIAEFYRSLTVEKLMPVFLKVATQQHKNMFTTIQEQKKNHIKNIERRGEPENIKMQNIVDFTNKIDTDIVAFMKACIISNKNNLDQKYSPEELDIIQGCGLDPNTLFIFEDCQEEIKSILGKKSSEASTMFKNMFNRGRHYFLSHWYALQDDKSLVPTLRKNARVSIFTQSSVANSFITTATNGIDKQSQKLGVDLCNSLFQHDKDHRKIIYFKDRGGIEKFQYHTASNAGLFCMGSSCINIYCDDIKKN